MKINNINQLPESFQIKVLKHLTGAKAKYTEVVSYHSEDDIMHILILASLQHDRYLVIKYFEATEIFKSMIIDSYMLEDINQYRKEQ